MFLQLIQPTYPSTSRAHAVVSIETFLLLLFAATPDTARVLGSFRFVSTHGCLGTSTQGLPKWYMGVQVSRRTRMQMGSQLIQGRNNDNPFSFFADDPTFIVPYYSIYRTRFRKNSIRIFHSRCFYGCSSHVSLSRRLQSNFGFDELRISNRYRSLLKLFWWSSRVRIKIDALTKLRPCNCSLIQRDIYTRNTYTCPVRYEFLQYTDASYSLLLYTTTYIVLPFQRLRLSND